MCFNCNIFKLNALAIDIVFLLQSFGNLSVYTFMMTNSVSVQILEAGMGSSWNL